MDDARAGSPATDERTTFLLRRFGQLDRSHRHHERAVRWTFFGSVALAAGFVALYAFATGRSSYPVATLRGVLPWFAAGTFWGLLGWTRRHRLDRAAVDEQRRAIAAELATREFAFDHASSVAQLFPRVAEFHEDELEPDEPSVWARVWDVAWLAFHARGLVVLEAYYLLLVAASVWAGLLELAPLYLS